MMTLRVGAFGMAAHNEKQDRKEGQNAAVRSIGVRQEHCCESQSVVATIDIGGIERMPIQLTPKAEALIRQKVRNGLYDNAEVALETAVQLLDAHDHRVQRLRAAIAEGEKGGALPWTPELMDQLSREADEMRRRGEKPDPDVCP